MSNSQDATKESPRTEDDPFLQGHGVRRSETNFTHGLTREEIYEAGEAFLMAVGTAVMLGHNSPNGAMDYVQRPEDPIRAIVWDSFAATRLDGYKKDAQDNLIRFAGQRGLLEAVAMAVAQ